MKKIKISFKKLSEKLNIKHKDDNFFNEHGLTHKPEFDLYVDTPYGLRKVNFLVTKKTKIFEYELENNFKLKVSNKHLVLSNKKVTTIEDAKSVDNIDRKSYKIINKKFLKEDIVYDISIDAPHIFYDANGFLHHNTKVSTYAFLYDLCRVLHLKNPQSEFKLPETTKIIFMLTNSSMETAESINYDPIIAIIRESPFFVEHFSKNGRTLFDKNIDIKITTRKRQLVGRDVFTALSDEVNQEVVKGGAGELVTEMINRINSRFLLKGNRWPGHYFVISSAQTENSLIEKLKEDFKEIKNSIEIINPARFEVLKHKIEYSGEKFKVFIGTYDADPFVINNDEDLQKALDIDPMRIFDIPIEHKQEFLTDIYAGIQDVLGKPTISTKTFLKDKDQINKAMSLSKLYNKDYILVSDDPDDRIIDNFDKIMLTSFDLNKPRVIGLDIGLSRDRLGFVMLHRASEIKVDRYGEKNGTFEDFIYWADLAIAMMPENPAKKLRLSKVRDFIRDLRELGFKIELIVTDGYQSEDTKQILENEGFQTKITSVDKTKYAYYALRYAIEESRIKLPENKILKEELSALIENEKKIDHLQDIKSNVEILRQRDLYISKDISDALANAIYNFQKIKPEPFENESQIEKLAITVQVKSDDNLYNKLAQFKKQEINYLN